MDTPERLAWVVYGSAESQSHLLQPMVDDAEKATVVLSLPAADTAMRWHRVPMEWRPRVWAGVQLLHDLRWHDGRNHESVAGCWVQARPLELFDPKCMRCRKRWTCRDCGEAWVVHDPCPKG